MNNLAIIDADSLLYHSSKNNIYDSIATIDERIKAILTKTKSDRFYLFLSEGPYFRHKVNPEYKANRKKSYGEPLLYLHTLKAYLREQWNAFSIKGLEADDLAAFIHNKLSTDPVVLCTTDKDLLKSIEGKHFNYTWKMINKGQANEYVEKGRFVETNPNDTMKFRMYQMLKGDIGDNIKGIPGKTDDMKKIYELDNRSGFGDLSVNKVIDYILASEYDIINGIVAVYSMYYGAVKGVLEFTKVLRQIGLLSTEEDMLRELGIIPCIPEPNDIQDFVEIQQNSQEQNKKESEPLF